MKQAIVIAISFIILSFGVTYGLDLVISKDYNQLNVSVMEDGEEIYSTPFSINKLVWFIDYDDQELILENEEVYDYFGFTEEDIDYDNFDPAIWEIIYEKTSDDAEINIVQIQDGAVSMYEANCEDRLCVKTGSISKANQVIICAPHKFVVKIKGIGEFDA